MLCNSKLQVRTLSKLFLSRGDRPSWDPNCQVNSDAFGEGWLMKVKLDNSSEADSLMDTAAYQKFCDEKGDH